jgi:tetratricopeptide (TPR) repeat protein
MTSPAELEGAIRKYESYVKTDPHNGHLWLTLGDFYHRASRLDDAIACYERCQLEDPQQLAARSRIALVRISQHRFAEAATLLSALLEAEPDNTSLLYNLGLALFYQDQWQEAKDLFSKALTHGLKSTDTLAYLTRCLHHLGETREAIEFCTQWLALAQDDSSKAALALLEMDDGNMPRARELAQQVLARDPDNVEASIVAGTSSVEQQEMENAERFFSRILQRQPDNPRAWLGIGIIHLYQQKHSAAIAALEKAVSLMPGNSGTIVALGWARLSARDIRGAEKTFRQALAVDHNFAESHGGLATTLALQARVDEAHAAIRIASRLDPANFGGHFASIIILKIRGRNELATKQLTRLLEQAPVPGTPSLIEHLRVFGTRQMQKSPPVRSSTLHAPRQ